MPEESGGQEAPTRRDYMKYGGVVVGGGLLAGCTGDGGSERTPTGDEQTSDAATETETTATEDPSYSVTMSPVGTVEFDAVPERYLSHNMLYLDTAVALGRGGGFEAIAFKQYVFYGGFYDALDLGFDAAGVRNLHNGTTLDKELFYELECDVHFIDPTYVLDRFSDHWDEADVEEIATNLGPWFGNRYSRAHNYPGDGEYEYYGLWELMGKTADVLRERETFERLEAIYDDLVDEIQGGLPPESERPRVALVYYFSDDEAFYPYHLYRPGFESHLYRVLGPRPALAEVEGVYGTEDDGNIDMEGMLEVDPDVLLHHGALPSTDDELAELRNGFHEPLAAHPVGSELQAVRNDRLALGPSPFQGPIFALFQLEGLAKELYPEQFGALDAEAYPELPPEDQLFDRQRVADVINGDF